MKSKFISVQELVEMAMLVALAVILDMDIFKIRVLTQGGSISLTMVPLFVLAFRHGLVKSFISIGIVYGFTTCLIDGYGLHTYPLDYLLGYGSIALAGLSRTYLFKNNKLRVIDFVIILMGVVAGCLGRLCFSTISGIVVYGNDFIVSLSANLGYIGPGAVLTIIALLFLAPALLLVKRMFPLKSNQKWDTTSNNNPDN